METKVSFAVVGAFVVALSAAGIGAVLWLGSGRSTQQAYETYLAFFDESVAGLNVRAPVKYKGVDVGQVREIDLDATDQTRVRLVLAIRRGVPVRQATVATLGVQGLTGIAYVELAGAGRDSPLLVAGPGEPYPVIRAGPSLLARLDTATTTLLADLDRTVLDVRAVLDEPTREAVRSTAADLARLTRVLARRSQDIDGAVASTARLLDEGARAAAALPGLLARLDRAAQAVERMADEVGQAGVVARASLGEVRSTAEDAAPDLRRVVGDLRAVTAALGRVAGELERDPKVLVLGRDAPPPGPGE